MQRDLYGELLSRALNRGAPQGHFAAYITPQEGGALRAMGGGVAPGGGQYMANGIPSFQEMGGVDPGIADPTGPTGGYGSAGFEMGFTDPSLPGYLGNTGVSQADVDAAEQAMGLENPLGRAERAEMARQMAAARMAEVDRRSAPVTVQALPAVSPTVQAGINVARAVQAGMPPAQQAVEDDYGVPTEYGVTPSGYNERGDFVGYVDDAFTGTGDRTSRNNPATDAFGREPGNVDQYGFVTEQGARNAQNNQSEGGLGYMSPGAMSVQAGMSFADLAAINSLSRDGGYSVNATNPDAHDLEVSFLNARYNPNFANAVYGIGGLVSPSFMMGVNAINARSPHAQYEGYESPGFGNILGQAARGIGLGGVVDAVGNVRSEIGEVLSGITDPITGAIGRAGTAIGEEISGAFSPVTDFFGDRPAPEQGPSIPQDGGNQEVFVPPQPAPVTEPFVSDDADDAERQFAEIPPDILARILATERFGRQRVGLA